jgi:hypothetical protein
MRGTLIMIGVGYEFATIVSQLPTHRCVDAVLLLTLSLLLYNSFKLWPFPVE